MRLIMRRTSEEDEISDRQAENGSVNNHTDSELEIPESQFSDPENFQSIAPTPTVMETATPSPFPVRKLSPVPSSIQNAGYFEGAGKRRRTS